MTVRGAIYKAATTTLGADAHPASQTVVPANATAITYFIAFNPLCQLMINRQNITHHLGLCKGRRSQFTVTAAPLSARGTRFPFLSAFPLQQVQPMWWLGSSAVQLRGALAASSSPETLVRGRDHQNPFDVAGAAL